MSLLYYFVHIEPVPQKGFYVSVPALPICRIWARTFDAALKQAKNQIEKHLKALVKTGKAIPIESQKVRPLCLPIHVNLPKGAKTILSSALLHSE